MGKRRAEHKRRRAVIMSTTEALRLQLDNLQKEKQN